MRSSVASERDINSMQSPSEAVNRILSDVCCSSLASVMVALFSTPFDVIRIRMQ
ncbi:MAG: hypothetical protein MHPSP_004529, partial [Paramarteilia canceri]